MSAPLMSQPHVLPCLEKSRSEAVLHTAAPVCLRPEPAARAGRWRWRTCLASAPSPCAARVPHRDVGSLSPDSALHQPVMSLESRLSWQQGRHEPTSHQGPVSVGQPWGRRDGLGPCGVCHCLRGPTPPRHGNQGGSGALPRAETPPSPLREEAPLSREQGVSPSVGLATLPGGALPSTVLFKAQNKMHRMRTRKPGHVAVPLSRHQTMCDRVREDPLVTSNTKGQQSLINDFEAVVSLKHASCKL